MINGLLIHVMKYSFCTVLLLLHVSYTVQYCVTKTFKFLKLSRFGVRFLQHLRLFNSRLKRKVFSVCCYFFYFITLKNENLHGNYKNSHRSLVCISVQVRLSGVECKQFLLFSRTISFNTKLHPKEGQ